ncbi:hypothetical protein [Nocardioides sp. cx-173]|uniref:hypothetical protein n=1 Tax=Nocardioides sp. cx-173 TaxID=2898796 RepID=UPI001E5AFF63|nr:hypothetical protein [Nocardioides sp. cx-173]MCD4524329.1 hypothetical protein [Nocardioides sp. cx-173]UGB41718.1 hypothetical protein LQ940_20485 [Nocardioides sp. cx-173]
MAKRAAFLHVGLDDRSGDVLDVALRHHSHPLAALGVQAPGDSGEELFRAALDILRTHRTWGYRRDEVEGVWSDICRRGHRGTGTLVVSQPMLAEATTGQVELLLDALRGFQRHVVLTLAAPDTWTAGDLDLGPMLDRWVTALGRPERVHVIVSPPVRCPATTWRAFGKVVGFGTASLTVDGLEVPTLARPPRLVSTERHEALRDLGRRWAGQLVSRGLDVRGDLADLVPQVAPAPDPVSLLGPTDAALAEALRTVERLERRNQTLESRVAQLRAVRRRWGRSA